MGFIYSPNMLLNIPGVGTEKGPQYAFDVNTSLTLIDQHDHSPGRGVQINPAGININAMLDMQNNALDNTQSIIFDAQSSIAALQALYVAPGTETPAINDLFYNDGAGNVVQLTANGTVNASIASLPGESYAAGTFFWKQGTGSTTPANFDIGSITIRPNVALTSNGVVLGPNAGIASQYSIQLPLPTAVTNIMSLDSSGNMAALINVDNTTIQLSSNTLAVKAGGITTTQISPTANILGSQLSSTAGIVGGQIASATIEGANVDFSTLGPDVLTLTDTITGQLHYASSSSVTTTAAALTPTIVAGFSTTLPACNTNRPVFVSFSGGLITVSGISSNVATVTLQTFNGLTTRTIASFTLPGDISGVSPAYYPASTLNCIAPNPTGATVRILVSNSVASAGVTFNGVTMSIVNP